MANLPQQLSWEDADNKWGAILNPIVANPLINGLMLKNVSLINGTTVVNHRLGRKLSGWFIVGINAPAQIYDNQATNQMPQLTLSLTSDADCIVSIWCF